VNRQLLKVMLVEDDGRGFKPAQATTGNGWGLDRPGSRAVISNDDFLKAPFECES